MSSFRLLSLRYIGRQPLRTALAAVAVAAAVTITVASTVLVHSMDISAIDTLKKLAGPAPLRVNGPLTRGGLEPGVLETVERTEGVDAAVPTVHGVVASESVSGETVHILAIGVDCRIEALLGAFGCDAQALPIDAEGPVLISPALVRQIGTDGVIRLDTGRVGVARAIRNDALDDINAGRIAIFELKAAQRFLDRGDNFDAIYVRPKRGTSVDALQQRLSDSVGAQNYVLRSDERPAWLEGRGPLIPLLGLGVLLSIGLSGLLVYNIVALSLAERRRDIAIASAVGTSPRATVRNILGEAAVLGLIGGVIGCVAGIYVGRIITASFASVITEQASGFKIGVHVRPSAILIGLAIGIFTSVGAALVPSRRALRLDLAAELHGRAALEESVPRRRLVRVAALLVLCGVGVLLSELAQRGGALEPWQPPLGAFALAIGGFLVFGAAGALAPLVLRLISPSLRSTGGATRVAVANVVTQPRRSSVIAAAVAAAVGLACVLGALIPAIQQTVATSDGPEVNDRVYATTLPLNNASNVDSKVSAGTLRELAAVPGVERIDHEQCVEVTDRLGVYSICAQEGELNEQVRLQVIRGRAGLAALEDGVVLGTGIARVRGLRPGDSLEIATPHGFRKVPVVGIWNLARDNGHSVAMSMPVHEELFGRRIPRGVFLRPESGVSAGDLERRVESARIDPDLYAMTGAQLSQQLADEIGMQVSPFWVLQRLLLFVALVGTLSTLLLVGVQRRRELGILGAVGFGPRALGRMTLAEALAAGAVGALLGAIGSSAVFETLRNAAAVSVGARPPFRFDPLSAVVAIAIALVVVAVGGALPAWRTSRLQIVEAIRNE
jgi:putative ABC transport system permease protein